MMNAEAKQVLDAARELAPVVSSRAADIESGRQRAQGRLAPAAALPGRATFRQHEAAAEGWFGQAGAALPGQPTGFWT